MKSFKRILVGVLAMLVMGVNVHAETLKECLDAANTDEVKTCKLDANVDDEFHSAYYDFTGKAVIDLNGHNLKLTHSITVKDGATLTITSSTGKGTIDATAVDNGNPVIVYAGGLLEIDNVLIEGRKEASSDGKNYAVVSVEGGKTTKFVLGSNGEITGYNAGVGISGTSDGYKNADSLTVEIAGTITTDSMAITTNGRIKSQGTPANITIKEGAQVTSNKNAGIYAGGEAKWTIEGGTITGAIGIVARQGSIDILDGLVKATGDGTNLRVGDAKTGDEYVKVPSGVAVIVDNTEEASYPESAKIKIEGGNFESTKEALLNYGNEENTEKEITVLGGKFNQSIDEKYLDSEDLGQSESGKIGTVYKLEVNKSENGKVTLQYSNAVEGEEVALTIAADEGYEIAEIKVVDQDGKIVTYTKTPTGIKFAMPASDVKISVSFQKSVTPNVGDQNPDNQDITDQTPTETLPNTNNVPKTADNIISVMSLGLLSIAVISINIKKLKKMSN